MGEIRRMSGRQAQAARNDGLILEAARQVFVADPEAPMSAVAARAGVGISALYRRYESKEDLLRRLCLDGLRWYSEAADAALAQDGHAWTAFTRFMERVVDADMYSLTLRLAGKFTPNEELRRESDRARVLNLRLFARIHDSGGVRPDLELEDLSFIFKQLASVFVADPARTAALRRRYLALMLDALRTPSPTPLPGPAPTWDEIQAAWTGPA